MRANVYTISKRLGNNATTLAARLRRVVGRDGDHLHASFFRFAVQDCQETRPSCVVGGFRQSGTGNALDVQIFVSDDAMRLDHLTGGLVVKIPALVLNMQVQLRYLLTGLVASVTALLAAGKATLCAPQLSFGLAEKLRRFDRLAVRRDKEGFQAKINTHRRVSGLLDGCLSKITRKDDVPAVRFPLEGHRFDLALNRAVQLDLEVADVLKVGAFTGQLATEIGRAHV